MENTNYFVDKVKAIEETAYLTSETKIK